MNSKKYKAVFFDRDGTLNVDTHYLHLMEDFIQLFMLTKAIFPI